MNQPERCGLIARVLATIAAIIASRTAQTDVTVMVITCHADAPAAHHTPDRTDGDLLLGEPRTHATLTDDAPGR